MNVQQMMRDYITDSILFGDGEKLRVDVPLQENGILDSLGVLEVITFMEQEFGIEIADDEVILDNFETLRKMSEFVERKMSGRTSHSGGTVRETIEPRIGNWPEAG